MQRAREHFALLHLGRQPLSDSPVSDSPVDSDWAPQMSVYVKTRGRLGRLYMALIAPFRHYIVYPAMMRAVERAWPGYVAAPPPD